MRIAERGEHAAQIRRDILHDERERHIFLLARGRKREIAERQKRDERHVVGDQHRTYERNAHKRDDARARVFEFMHDGAGGDIEKVNSFQGAHRRGHGKQARERFEIEIAEILFIRRHDKRRDERKTKRDAAHRVFFDEFYEFVFAFFTAFRLCFRFVFRLDFRLDFRLCFRLPIGGGFDLLHCLFLCALNFKAYYTTFFAVSQAKTMAKT